MIDKNQEQKEIWQNIIIEEENSGYKVSNKGRVKKESTGKIMKPFLSTQKNRPTVIMNTMTINGKQKFFPTHRLVAKAFVEGNSVENNCVKHINGNKKDNRAENLKWISRSEIGKNRKKPLTLAEKERIEEENWSPFVKAKRGSDIWKQRISQSMKAKRKKYNRYNKKKNQS